MKNTILLTLVVFVNKFQPIIDLLLSFSKTKGVSFVGIRGYRNSSGEISDVVINVGASYDNAKVKDIEFLRTLDVKTVKSRFTVNQLEEARRSLLGGLIAPSEARSEGQKNAYTHITNGLKLNNASGKLHIWGFSVSKKVLVEGTYKHVNSSDATLAKKDIQKLMKSTQYRTYIIDNLDSVKMNGEIMEF